MGYATRLTRGMRDEIEITRNGFKEKTRIADAELTIVTTAAE